VTADTLIIILPGGEVLPFRHQSVVTCIVILTADVSTNFTAIIPVFTLRGMPVLILSVHPRGCLCSADWPLLQQHVLANLSDGLLQADENEMID